MSGAICGPAMKIIGQERGEPRWCFGCRKRWPGTWTCHATVEPSYYEPHWSYACDGCGQDRIYFPGTGPL